jgi:hypothetical protein
MRLALVILAVAGKGVRDAREIKEAALEIVKREVSCAALRAH